MAYLTELHYVDETHRETHRHEHEAPPLLETLVAALKRLKGYESHAMIDRVHTFIRSHITDRISVDDLADLAGTSASHFAHQYKALTGRTPMEDVRFMRLEEARRLITTSNLTLADIAPRVGFSSEYNLSHLLKTHLGAGVRELRKSEKR